MQQTRQLLAVLVRRARRALGQTQAGLSARARVSLATVQAIEAGTANPSLSTLDKLFGVLGLALEIEPRAADWDALAQFGLPISVVDRAPADVSLSEVPEHVRRAALELSEGRPGPQRERKRESLEALLLALSLHFPSVYREWFARAPGVRALVPSDPTGRVIKLARVARARLAERL